MPEPMFKPWWARNTSTNEVFHAVHRTTSNYPTIVAIRTEGATKPSSRIGLIVSAALHLLLAGGLLVHPLTSSFGAPGNDIGTGIPVALVSGFASGGASVGPVESDAPEAAAEVEPQTAEQSPPLDTGSDLVELPKPIEDQDAARPRRRAAMALAHLGQAANTFDGAVGADGAQGGNPTAASDLLGQIARCLPPDFRPRLAFSRLTLSIDANGRLNAAPAVSTALPQIDRASRAAADRIVQAVLLCGPYSHPDATSRVVVLPADFSQVAARR